MWFFALNGMAYLLYTFFSGARRELLPTRHSFAEAIEMTLHDLRLSKRHGGSIFGLRSPTLAFFLVHVVQVIRAGWNNFRAMIIDYEISPDKMAKREEVPDEQSISPS
jgi:hypothetical protein